MSETADAESSAMFEDLLGPTTEIGAPCFAEPWHAQAFALTVGLHQQGLFTWSEWADILGAEIKANPDTGYYESWLKALETLVSQKSFMNDTEMLTRKSLWAEAVAATPHGEPIELENAASFAK